MNRNVGSIQISIRIYSCNGRSVYREDLAIYLDVLALIGAQLQRATKNIDVLIPNFVIPLDRA